MVTKNKILKSDSYKYSHAPSQEETQFPEGTSYLEYYIESRGGQYSATEFAGLQVFLKDFLSSPITREDVIEARDFMLIHGEPFNYKGWMGIVEKHNGYFPIRIKAVAEGAIVPVSNVLVKVETTDPEFFWVAGWIETALLRAVWYPTSIGTRSWNMKKKILQYLELTSDDPWAEINWKLQDFGARGVSSGESAELGGMAHLINFMGSDTVEGILCANRNYNCEMAGFSIPASEHSTMTSYGRQNEIEACRNKIKLFAKPGKLFAVVSDSWDIFHCVEHIWCGELLEDIKNSGATLVIRPDSGVPHEVILKILQIIERKLGITNDRKTGVWINSKGYKVLPDFFRIIQGDGIKDETTIDQIYSHLVKNAWSASNLGFGSGGGLLQIVNRDTQRFAYKCNRAIINGEQVDVYKAPITDNGKRSKSGYLDLIIDENSQYKTVNYDAGNKSCLLTVWENGKILVEHNLADMRTRADKALVASM